MKYFITAFICFIQFANPVYSQEVSDIILQCTGESVTLRKSGENHVMMYSEKNSRMILTDLDKEMDPDPSLYIVKPTVTIFKLRESQSSHVDTVVRILFYYIKKNQSGTLVRKEAETYSNESYNLLPAKLIEVKEANANKLHFVVDSRDGDSDFIMDGNGTKDAKVFFIYKNRSMPFSNYALMITNLKTTIVGGEKIN